MVVKVLDLRRLIHPKSGSPEILPWSDVDLGPQPRDKPGRTKTGVPVSVRHIPEPPPVAWTGGGDRHNPETLDLRGNRGQTLLVREEPRFRVTARWLSMSLTLEIARSRRPGSPERTSTTPAPEVVRDQGRGALEGRRVESEERVKRERGQTRKNQTDRGRGLGGGRTDSQGFPGVSGQWCPMSTGESISYHVVSHGPHLGRAL